MNYFINFSNHPSKNWSEKQLTEANKYGEIIDIAFPNIDPSIDGNAVKIIMDDYIKQILSYNPKAVMCQGEMTAAFYTVSVLLRKGIKTVAACSERRVIEENKEGINRKTVEFVFTGFRDYVL